MSAVCAAASRTLFCSKTLTRALVSLMVTSVRDVIDDPLSMPHDGRHFAASSSHHLFPDLPSNRLAQIAVRVRQVCDRYDVPYTSSSLVRQHFLVLRTVHKLALPNHFLMARSDDAPETASERNFLCGAAPVAVRGGAAPVAARGGAMRGLRTALRERAFDGRYRPPIGA